MISILVPVFWLAAAGLMCGLALAVAARFFTVKEDERIGKITSALSGANCGGCGFPGCSAYAAAIVAGKAPVNKCAPGGAKAAAAIAEIMGLRSFETESIPKVAIVMCSGDADSAKRSFCYNGIIDCASAAAVAGGDKTCSFGCLGYGTCVRACSSNAIEIVNNVAKIRKELCIGCGKCTTVCPRHVIELVPKNREVHVFCKSKDSGAAVRKYCSKGCLGCKLCEKFAGEAIIMNGALASVNYNVDFTSEEAIQKCPAKCLRRV